MMATKEAKRVLVVEDDRSISLGLRMNLEDEGLDVSIAEDGETGLERARSEHWDLMILDVMLPRLNGYELLCTLRSEHIDIPVLILSARTAEVDRIMGLDLGADDYVTKPFSVGELLARVRAALRRGARTAERWAFGGVEVDPESRQVFRDGVEVELTPTEFDVLQVMLRARGRVLSRQQIMDLVWGPGHHGTPRTVDNFLAQLRSKLEADPSEPEFLITVRGVGYRFAQS
jgi:DNA-binding response OmpR family regulator